MTDTKWAEVRTENGHQIIILPADIHLETDRVDVHQNDRSGEITLSPPSTRPSLEDFFAFCDTLPPISDEDWWAFEEALSEARGRPLFGDH